MSQWETLCGNVEQCAKDAVGNWRQFGSFGWYDKPEDAEQWYIVYTHNRDSGCLDESNAHVIAQALEVSEFENDVRSENHSHWACGWIAGYSIRVYDAKGDITPAFRKMCELASRLADYPILDENDYSEREFEATLENIRQEGHNVVKDGAPEDWCEQVFSWLWDNNQGAVENRDDQGGYPDKDDIRQALEALGIQTEEE